MQTYKRRAAASGRAERTADPSPMAGGMPSLTEGAGRKELPEAMRTKMENAFGADFSNLNIYESEKVAEGGARAVTQGNTIAFAPGEFNVYSPSSEALLGHELSHVVSQARGESRGSGLLTDSYLEAKADREGVMAAAGQQVYSGPITPLSNSSPMSVAGPMQCKWGRGKKKDKKKAEKAPEAVKAPEPVPEKPKAPAFELPEEATYDNDLAAFQSWQMSEGDHNKENNFAPLLDQYQYDSTSEGEGVGSIYFGGTHVDDYKTFGEEWRKTEESRRPKGKMGGRIRLLHDEGPAIYRHTDVFRTVKKMEDPHTREVGDHLVEYEGGGRMASAGDEYSMDVSFHKSRGVPEKKSNLSPEDYKKLFHAVQFAERIATFKKNGVKPKGPEKWKQVNRANLFLYAYMQSDPTLRSIPLNTNELPVEENGGRALEEGGKSYLTKEKLEELQKMGL